MLEVLDLGWRGARLTLSYVIVTVRQLAIDDSPSAKSWHRKQYKANSIAKVIYRFS